MDTTLLTTGLLIGGVGTIIYQLRTIPVTIWNKIKKKLVYTIKIYQYDELLNKAIQFSNKLIEDNTVKVYSNTAYEDFDYKMSEIQELCIQNKNNPLQTLKYLNETISICA